MLKRSDLARMNPRVLRAVEEAEAADRARKVRRRPPKQARIPETEKRYYRVLLGRQALGKIRSFEHQPMPPLTLGRNCTYTPDFRVVLPDGSVEYHEVKGAMLWEDSRIKWKWAGEKYQEFRFVWARWKNGKWKVSYYKPLAGQQG